LLLAACGMFDRPELTLQKANQAWVDKDLAAFEALVDLDAVAPDALEGCARLSAMRGMSDRQFQPRTGWTELGVALEEGMVKGIVELAGPEVAEQARQDFGTQTMEQLCPAMAPGDMSDLVVHKYEGGADLDVPVLVHGEGTHVVVKMQKLDSGWKVTALSFDAAEEEYRAKQLERARSRAAELLDQLEGTFSRSVWLELEAYVANNPDDPTGPKLRALVDPLLNADTPVVATEAWLQERRLPGFRDAKARVQNTGSQTAKSVTVRFELQDSAGRTLRNVDGEDGLQGVLAASLAPGDQATFGVPGAGVLLFPDATQVRAVPTSVVYDDGSVWTHPAVEAGLWTR
jgi:hypothetical protein